jgi:gamma-glutamylaminecyclotransferase
MAVPMTHFFDDRTHQARPARLALVVVYGTLMRDRANHRVLARTGARFVDVVRTLEERTLVDLGPYPALLPRDGPLPPVGPVHGELWEVPSDGLAILDDFEGCPDLYRREIATVVRPDGAELVAETYVLARAVPAGARVLVEGRYARR